MRKLICALKNLWGLHPKSAIDDYDSAIRHGLGGEHDKALALFGMAILRDSKFARAYGGMGVSYHKKGEKEKAIECFKKAIELDPWGESGKLARKALQELVARDRIVVCHKCKDVMQEGEGYWVGLQSWHYTAENLPVGGHFYCGTCIDIVYEIAFGKDLKWAFKRLFLGPGALSTAEQVREHIMKKGWTKEQWKAICRKDVAWWWERHALVSQGRVPLWEHTISDIDRIIFKYREQPEAWNICGQICDSANVKNITKTIGAFDTLIEGYPDFAAYACYCRGVWLDRSGNAKSAISDFSKALEIDPQLHWAYYYRAMCYYKIGNREKATEDKDLALKLIPNLKRSFIGD